MKAILLIFGGGEEGGAGARVRGWELENAGGGNALTVLNP